MTEQKELTPRNTPAGNIFLILVVASTVAIILSMFWPSSETEVVTTTLRATPSPTPVPAPEIESPYDYDLTDLLELEWTQQFLIQRPSPVNSF